jgi:hypothetical protein
MVINKIILILFNIFMKIYIIVHFFNYLDSNKLLF